jgi:hypothetical protein
LACDSDSRSRSRFPGASILNFWTHTLSFGFWFVSWLRIATIEPFSRNFIVIDVRNPCPVFLCSRGGHSLAMYANFLLSYESYGIIYELHVWSPNAIVLIKICYKQGMLITFQLFQFNRLLQHGYGVRRALAA